MVGGIARPDHPGANPCSMPGMSFGSGEGEEGKGDRVRGLKKGPLLAAVALPVLFAAFGTALVGGSGLDWYAGLDKPRFLVPLRVFYLVGFLYYALAPSSSTVSWPASRIPGAGPSLSGLQSASCSSTSCGTTGSSACKAR